MLLITIGRHYKERGGGGGPGELSIFFLALTAENFPIELNPEEFKGKKNMKTYKQKNIKLNKLKYRPS